MKILITGTTGMLGLAVRKNFKEAFPGAAIYILNRTRDLSASQVFVSLGVEEISKHEFDVVVHAGSPASPKDHVVASNVFHANVNLTEQLVNSVRRGGVFIYFSSGEVYGRSSTKSLNEDSPLRPVLAGPRSYYPLAKLAGESISMSRSDIRSVVFRVFHTFGPGLREGDGRSFGDLLWGAKKHSRLELFSSGSQVRSFLDSRDLARAVELSARKKWVSGVFNVGSEQEISIRQFADLVASLTDSKITYSNPEASPVELSSIERLVPNIDKLKNIGWERTISLERTIIETVSSFRT
jgi:nucleoside-diphosphate-sugar epimerase